MGAVAQLGEHLLCKQGVTGSIPVISTNLGDGDRLKVKGYTNPSRFEVFVELLLSLGWRLHPACPSCGCALRFARTVPGTQGLVELQTFSCRECSLWITESADEHPFVE